MVQKFSIKRERWSIEEIPSPTGKRLAGFALVIGDEHFPEFEYPESRTLANGLNSAADRKNGCTIPMGDEQIIVEPAADGVTIFCSGKHSLSSEEAKLLAKDLIAPLAQTLSGPR